MTSDWAVGVDLGGTNIRAAEVDISGKVGHMISEPLDRNHASEPFGQLVSIIGRLIGTRTDAPIGIGVGATGPIETATGFIDNPFTLPPSFQGDARSPLVAHFGLPVRFENDANAAALAEARFGEARASDSVVCITVGTGVGVGAVHHGRLHRGANGIHPESGHMVIDPTGPECYCGADGCLESLSSSTAVLRAGIRAGVVPPSGAAIDVHEAAARGDAVALRIVRDARTALAIGARNLVAVHGADAVVFAGGGVGDPDELVSLVRSMLSTYSFAPRNGVLVTTSNFGNLAGSVGAASLFLNRR